MKTHHFKAMALAALAMLLAGTAQVQAQCLRDRGGAYIGKIESDGTVRDRGGAYRGKAENVKRRHAAVFFFFDFF